MTVPIDYTNLRARGFSLPASNTTASQVANEVKASVENRSLVASMQRKASTDVAMALPKVRQPMSTLADKKIPYDINDPNELVEIRRWSRLHYSTHSLLPLLIDIYAKFPTVGVELHSKDPEITRFYEEMFFDNLDYELFLQDLGKEYFIAGEVNSLAHFNESLGIWASEEILNPDTVRVSKSMFRQGERVQLMVKSIVEGIRGFSMDDQAPPSEKLERNLEYQHLVENYPEMIEAAAMDDGLDISDALISRIINKTNAWDVRGTPHMLRCFRDLMMEESLNAAQDAVADRLYSPMVLATLGINNLGDDAGPWIPSQEDLAETRTMLNNALASDFRLLVHHFGLDIRNVFGRESVPRFDQDFSRIDRKIMQAWGIGDALIGGSGGGSSYASSALNREFATQLMVTFQKQVVKHMRKRMSVIAEAQGHFDFELSGGVKKPIYRNIVDIDENGNEYVRKAPKLLIPDIKFRTLDLRDEAQERQFLQSLRNAGVPVSDEAMMVNVDISFEDEIEKQAAEKVEKLVAEAQAMRKAQHIIEEQNLPIPPDLARYLAAQAQLEVEKEKAKTEEEKRDVIRQVGESGGVIDDNGVLKDIDGDKGFMEEKPLGTPIPDMLNNSKPQPGDVDNRPDINNPEEQGGSTTKAPAPRNRSRPEISDEKRKDAPKAAGKKFGAAPSSYGSSLRLAPGDLEANIAALGNERSIVALVDDGALFESLNRTDVMSQVQSDIAEIDRCIEFDRYGDCRLGPNGLHVAESFDILCDIMDQYEAVYGYRPEF